MRLCTVEGCGEAHEAKGYCKLHYNRWRRNGTPELRQTVETFVCGCAEPVRGKGFWDEHECQTCFKLLRENDIFTYTPAPLVLMGGDGEADIVYVTPHEMRGLLLQAIRNLTARMN